jgi:hypothetical protein
MSVQRCHEDKTAAHIPPPTEHALIVTKVSLSVEQTHTDHMAPSLRDVLMNELLGVIGLTVPVKPEDGNTYKLITRLFNPSTYRCSPDKAAHEMAHVKGSKRGGHFYWLLRKVRSLATDSDDPVIKSHTLDILEAFPVFDPLLEKQSVEFCNFDKGMTVKRNLLQLEVKDKVVVPRIFKRSSRDIDILSGLKKLRTPVNFVANAHVMCPIPVCARQFGEGSRIDTVHLFV